MIRSDSDIQQHVEAELSCCPDIDETGIGVRVASGVVTLNGYARNVFDKYGAEDAVKRVPGVVAVANDINVQPLAAEAPLDPEIARCAVAAIKHQLPLCWAQIRPLVRRGCVTLEGTVDWIYQREEAEAAVRGLKGVACVINSIALAPSVRAVRAEDVTRFIAKSFQCRTPLGACAVTVETSAGEVILRGRVCSWMERAQAEQAAWLVQGVQQVRNELVVDSQLPLASETAPAPSAPNGVPRAADSHPIFEFVD